MGLDQLVADLHTTTLSALSLLRSVNTLAANSHGTDISLPDLDNLGALFASTRTQLTSDDRAAAAFGDRSRHTARNSTEKTTGPCISSARARMQHSSPLISSGPTDQEPIS